MKSMHALLVGALLLLPAASVGCGDEGGGTGGGAGGGVGGGTGGGGGDTGGGGGIDDGGIDDGGVDDGGVDDGGMGGGGGDTGGEGTDGGSTVSDAGIPIDGSFDGAVYTCGFGCTNKGGTCNYDTDTCEIPGNANGPITCPEGTTCVFDCNTNDCTSATVECDNAIACEVQCGTGRCNDLLCVPLVCTCSGDGADECVTSDA